MKTKKDAVAIIPARGGSKRIFKKNIKEFHGKPIIAYSIELALKSNLFDRVIVSTDDTDIAEISKEYGAEIPFMRPDNISDDFSTIDDVLIHALNAIDSSYKYSCTILPTAPFLRMKYLKNGYEHIKENNLVNTFSACATSFTIQRAFKLNSEGRCEMFNPENFTKRSQDFEEAYQDAGQFYWTNLKNKNPNDIMFSDKSFPIIIPKYLVQDIDSMEDWHRAELMYETIFKNN
tara:strand:- start:172 stop:870 length:699 start_codon:yes stop_codon:yes gene_type:complete